MQFAPHAIEKVSQGNSLLTSTGEAHCSLCTPTHSHATPLSSLSHARTHAHTRARTHAQVVDVILKEKPGVVFAPHVETSTGMILPDDYIKQVSDAVHSVGGVMVLDCIASGTVWVDMQKTGVDALISAPQKGWTGPACAGLVMLSDLGADVTRSSRGSSFVCDLRKWLELMDT